MSLNGWRPDIEGWSTDILPFYDRLANELPDGARVCEMGVYHGRSLGFLAQRFRELGKRQVTLVGVDSFVWHDDDLAVCMRNLASIDGSDRIMLVVAPSLVASRMFEPFDLVFIDGFHDYETIQQDIAAWRTLVRRGGILSGHDYGDGHPGVRRAVDEAFGQGGVEVTDTVWCRYM